MSPTWVVGVEGDWSWTDAKGSFEQPWVSVPDLVNPGVRPGTLTSMSMGPNWLATVRGRIGYLVTPTALLYFTGAVPWPTLNIPLLLRMNRRRAMIASTSFSRTANGYVLGGGLEWAVSSQWLLRTEYLFYQLNTGTEASF